MCLSPREPQSWISVPPRAAPGAPHAQTPVREPVADTRRLWMWRWLRAASGPRGRRRWREPGPPAERTRKCPISHFPRNPLLKQRGTRTPPGSTQLWTLVPNAHVNRLSTRRHRSVMWCARNRLAPCHPSRGPPGVLAVCTSCHALSSANRKQAGDHVPFLYLM